ncbi:MAG: UTP--glucose-1-phosphate uridylyltransferase [Verrucomicrobia bacterium]|nr:UTP--glucose-1-phosphate uridylyltransferase [Verrucomicrobiota bacterium]
MIFRSNPFEKILSRARKKGHTRFLLFWNRGLGDLPLGLYAIIHKIREEIPSAKISFLTRRDLAPAFAMLPDITVHIAPHWKRGEPSTLDGLLSPADYDVIIEKPDPTKWVRWQLGKLIPKLRWDPSWDALAEKFSLPKERTYVGFQVQTETAYGYEKNWPLERYLELFDKLYREQNCTLLLFGFAAHPPIEKEGVIDLRGKTSLLEMFSLIKNCCRYLVLPDSGLLSITYYLAIATPIRIVSLWADPRQGVLKQNVSSPNPLLEHIPLFGPNEQTAQIGVDAVMDALFPPIHRRQRALLFHPPGRPDFAPLSTYESSGSESDRLLGEELLREGKVGCIIVAGGQATRLGCAGPKGAIVVTPCSGKSLFQLFSERARRCGRLHPLAIMTSPLNHDATLGFFRDNHFEAQPVFFQQGMLPFLDDRGNYAYDAEGKLLAGPDGNGLALHRFVQSGIWQEWKRLGVEYLSVIPVDNPLADPFDPELIGFAKRKGVDCVLKAIERLAPDEKMGVIGESGGKIGVVEYSELPENHAAFSIAHTGMLCFSMDFLTRLPKEMPLHLARKQGMWKCETFLFDLLPYAHSAAVLVYPREKVYAPLKNATGPNSLETVKRALSSAEESAIFPLK